MTDRELRKLKRSEILELMVEQSDEIEALKKRLEAAEEKLAMRTIILERAGSIAEAALALNHVFEDAQKAADQYLENVMRIREELPEKEKENQEGGPEAQEGKSEADE